MSSDTALVVIDVQLGMFAGADPVSNGDDLLVKLNRLIGRARAAGVPVIYVQHDGGPNDPLEPGTPGWPIHPAIAPAADELIVRKRTPDAFHETTLQQELNSRGIRKLVLAGLQTEYCVDTTCRRAFSLGYQVALAQDAHSTWNTDTLTAAQIIAHHNTVLGDWFATLRLTDEIDFQAL